MYASIAFVANKLLYYNRPTDYSTLTFAPQVRRLEGRCFCASYGQCIDH